MINSIMRYQGCLLGLAVGDAIGTTLEFKQPGTFEIIKNMVGGGPFRLEAGEWTDDTSMALCLAASLVECQGFNPADQMERYLRWRDEGYMGVHGKFFDIGGTIATALSTYQKTRNPFSGPISPNTAGNGSLMRLAPVPMFYANNPEEAIEKSGESSRTTHGAQSAVDACCYFAGLLVGALSGEGKTKLLSRGYSPIPGYWGVHVLDSSIDEIASGSFKVKHPPEIRGSGYVVKTLEAALWAFYRSDSFEEGCLLAVNLGEDADTTGAIFGQLAGAFYGRNQIPAPWLSRLAEREKIELLADKLYQSRLAN